MWWTPILELLGQVLTKVIPDTAARDRLARATPARPTGGQPAPKQ